MYGGRFRGWLVLGCWLWAASIGFAELVDEFDSYPPRWRLANNDCDAQVLKHENLSRGGHDGGPCETLTVRMGQGGSAWLAYPIEPIRPLDDLVARVWVSADDSVRVGFRLRYPYVRDPETKSALAVMISGAAARDPSHWTRVGIGGVEKSVRAATMSVRNRFGRSADVRDVMIDAVLLDIYTGPATHTVSIDHLVVEGMVPVAGTTASSGRGRAERFKAGANESATPELSATTGRPFPIGRITRILQYNGEPIAWVRSLGFDAVWLNDPVDASILGEAIRHNMKIYAPPPSVVDPDLESMLDPVAGWILDSVVMESDSVDSVSGVKQPAGSSLDYEMLDDQAVPAVAERIERLRRLPPRWKRPVVAAPRESFREYSVHLDGMIYDLPPRTRGLSAAEESSESLAVASLASTRLQFAVGVDTLPPDSLVAQTSRIATVMGVSPPTTPGWQGLWSQVFRHLPEIPSAVLYRSSRSLTADPVYDANRSTALSYINRMMAMIEPWLATAGGIEAVPMGPGRLIRTTGSLDYHQGEFKNESTHWWIATSQAGPRGMMVAGDGGEMVIPLANHHGASQVWRLTHFSAERLPVEETPAGPVVRIVSPDVVEVVVQSGDASVGGKLARAAARFARQAVADRWMMVEQSLGQTRNAWQVASTTRSVATSAPAMLTAASQTLELARPEFYANDLAAAIHAARRADAWTLRARSQLAEQLARDQPQFFSSPCLDVGGLETQGLVASIREARDQSRTESWSENLITTGSLDDARALGPGRWSFGNRLEDTVASQISHLKQRTYAGVGALRATSAAKVAVARGTMPRRIGGGFGGTVMQIRSPSVRVPRDTELQIDVMIRSIGFSGPHQGVLVYDSVGGQAAGVLVRDAVDWTPVRLRRFALNEGEVSVYFEIIGDGEAMIDEVSLKVRQRANGPVPIRPLVSQADEPAQSR